MQKTNHKNFHKECDHIISIFQDEELSNFKGNLFLGNVHTLGDGRFKYLLGIDCVVSVLDKECYQSSLVENNLKKQQVTYHKWIDIEDIKQVSIYPYFHDVHKYIRQKLNQTNVLVHCRAGVSRSASLVIAFLMKQYGMNFDQAKKYIKHKRDRIKPNQGFVQDLQRFQKQLKNLNQKIKKN